MYSPDRCRARELHDHGYPISYAGSCLADPVLVLVMDKVKGSRVA